MTSPQLCLAVPIEEAVLFALGLTDLDLDEPSDQARQLIGLIAVDHLEYSEQWRLSGIIRTALKQARSEMGPLSKSFRGSISQVRRRMRTKVLCATSQQKDQQ